MTPTSVVPKRRAIALGVALALSLSTLAAAEDLTIVSTVSAGKGTGQTSTQYLSADHARTTNGDSDVIIDYAQKSFVFVDHKKKRYWKTTPEEINAQFAQLAAMLEDNPIMERFFGDAGTVAVAALGSQRTIAGYECDDYEVSLGEAYRFRICAAKSLTAPISYHAALDMTYANMGPMAGKLKGLLDAMKEIEGMPLRTEFSLRLMGQSIESISEAQEVKKGPLGPDTFTYPSNYKETKSPYAQ
jgi:hypothetical protein